MIIGRPNEAVGRLGEHTALLCAGQGQRNTVLCSIEVLQAEQCELLQGFRDSGNGAAIKVTALN